MAFVVKDRVKVSSTTTGTGTFTLGSTASGFQSFSVIGDGNTTSYTILDANSGAFEVGLGIFTLSGTTLSRDTVLESSNSGSLVNFGAGTKDVFVAYPAERAVFTDVAQVLTNKTVTDSTFFIQDDADDTKKAQFQLSNLTTATTRTYTFPNASVTLATQQTFTGIAVTGSSGSSSWTSSDPYTAILTVTGLLSTDTPIVDIDLSSVTFADVEDVQADWALVYRASATGDNELTLYATAEPVENFTLIVQVVR